MYPNEELAPQDIVESLIRYRDGGIRPGLFLYAVLANDLSKAVTRADSDNLSLLPHIVAWVYRKMPSTAWGNREKVAAWIKAKDAERSRDEDGKH